MADPAAYETVVARNIVAARARLKLSQRSVATRMTALGFGWRQQTVDVIERGDRRLAIAEILGLAEVLRTSLGALLGPSPDDKLIAFPSGRTIPAESVRKSLLSINDDCVRWDGDKPEFSDGDMPLSQMFEQLTTSLIASQTYKQQDKNAAQIKEISSAFAAQDAHALLAQLPANMREQLLAMLQKQVRELGPGAGQ